MGGRTAGCGGDSVRAPENTAAKWRTTVVGRGSVKGQILSRRGLVVVAAAAAAAEKPASCTCIAHRQASPSYHPPHKLHGRTLTCLLLIHADTARCAIPRGGLLTCLLFLGMVWQTSRDRCHTCGWAGAWVFQDVAPNLFFCDGEMNVHLAVVPPHSALAKYSGFIGLYFLNVQLF